MTAHHPPQAGRRPRFVPRVEALEDRRVPAVNFIVQDGVLFIVSPTVPGAHPARIVITDNGTAGPNNVTAAAPLPFSPNVPISTVVVVNRGRGQAQVAYNLVGNLSTTRTVDVNLGGGNDRFVATIRRNLLTGSSLTINAKGGGGNDDLQAVLIGSLAANSHLALNYDGGGGNNIIRVSSATLVNLAAGSSLIENLTGGGFADRVVSEYQGVLGGRFQINEQGGRGPNTEIADVEIAAGSTGTVLPSTVIGGPQNDMLTFLVHNRSGIPANQNFLDGDGGFNIGFRTTNVIANHLAIDHVVP